LTRFRKATATCGAFSIQRLALSIEQKQFHDIVGYYNRFDIFRLVLDQRPQPPMTVLGNAIEAAEEAREGDRSSLGESIATVIAQDSEDPAKWRRKTAS
jgi:hypothetical protein